MAVFRTVAAHVLSVILACTVPVGGLGALAGRDIVRIINPDGVQKQGLPETPDRGKLPEPETEPERKQPERQQPERQPERQEPERREPERAEPDRTGPQRRDPDSQRADAVTGRFVNVRVRLGAQSTDPRKGWLGVRMDNDAIDRAFALSTGWREAKGGVLMVEIAPGGPALAAGLRVGDIVTSLDGTAVSTADALRKLVAERGPNVEVTLDAWRFVPDGADFLSTLRLMANGSNTSAMAMLGANYAKGKVTGKDDAEAVRWYRRAAELGHAPAMIDLATMIGNGRGVERNAPEAMRWFKAAADSGNIVGQWRYGLALLDGKLVAKDPNQAVPYIRRAAESGLPPAIHDLALLYENGTGVPKNYEEAVRWYRKAIDLNYAASMVNLGILHEEGKGVERSEVKAAELYKRAADLGQVNGLHNYGVKLDNGRVVPRNSQLAADYVLRALAKGGEFSHRQMLQNHMAYSAEFRMTMQRRLQQEGLYNGPIDGSFGPTTQAAITAYFKRSQPQQ